MDFKYLPQCKLSLQILLLSAFFSTIAPRTIFADNFNVNHEIDKNFVEWSNSVSEEEAKIQLQRFLSSFDSAGQAREWLAAKGFRVEEPRQVSEKIIESDKNLIGLEGRPVYTFVAGWDARRDGIIFENNFILRQIDSLIYYGVSIEVTYTNDNFKIHRITITRSSL